MLYAVSHVPFVTLVPAMLLRDRMAQSSTCRLTGFHSLTPICLWLQVGYIDDRYGPLCLAAVITLALSGIFIVSAIDFAQQLRSK